MFDHISDALTAPSIIKLQDGLYVARFELMKLYTTQTAVEQLLKKGVVKPGDTLVDSSSGIYAYSLALVCMKHGLKCRVVASRSVDDAMRIQLELLGVTVEGIEASPTLKMDQELRVNRCKEIVETESNVHWMRQYHDDIHYLGYANFADLILKELGSNDLTIVLPVGTGCSSGGLATALLERDVEHKLLAIQPFGSVTFGGADVIDPGFVIAGIGSGINCENIRHEFFDRVHWVSHEYSSNGCVALMKDHGVFAGLSSGACYLVASREKRERASGPVLFIAPDTGHRYIDSVYREASRSVSVESLSPHVIQTIDELRLPWSEFSWNRRSLKEAVSQTVRESYQ